ncbi:MAG: tetrathionate reductase family octaheme c-type cytochrome [Acidobacteriota bacterium]
MRRSLTSVSSSLLVATALAASAAGALAASGSTSHEGLWEHYEGTKTCLKCHRDAAESFFHSVHYQWKGPTPDVPDAEGGKLGKINVINDFCTNPRINWIGEVRNAEGRVLALGCSKCHAGRGMLPSEKMTEEQLLNIDCLMCHAKGYRRDLYRNEDGSWEWKPILWQNQEGLDIVSQRISLPTKVMCLRCHSGSGGGPNYKRGDLEYRLADCDRTFDVHMGTDGAGFECIDCHKGRDHRVRGRGADLADRDLPGEKLLCSDCHGEQPHEVKVLDHHTARVYCTACHIPEFAKEDPTDMLRDWSTPVRQEERGRWYMKMELRKNVKPEFAWFNGRTRMALAGQPVEPLPTGEVPIAMPLGSREDPDAKIYAFKVHRARLPVLDGKNWLIPIITEEYYADDDGDISDFVREAAEKFYGIEDAKFHWVDTIRWMGIFHEVVPAESALGCLDCHGPDGRMDWKRLGYDADPLEALLDRAGSGTPAPVPSH